MTVRYFAFLIKYFPFFLFKRVPFNLFFFYRNSLKELNNRLQVKLQLRLFFVPLFGDSHWSLRIVGIFYRLFSIIAGTLFITFYSVCYLIFSLIIIIFLPVTIILFKYPLFYLLLLFLTVFLIYILYYYFNPFFTVLHNKKYYTYFDLYTMSPLSTRFLISAYIKKKDIKDSFGQLSLFLEEDTNKIYSYFTSSTGSSVAVCKSAVDLAKKTGYRHISKNLFLCGVLKTSDEFLKYLNLEGLPENTLNHYLITIKKEFKINNASIWDADYESSYSYPYNVAKLDRTTPALNDYSVDLSNNLRPLSIMHLKSFKNYKLELVKVLSEGSKKALIIGESGTGKTSLVYELYLDIKKGNVPFELQFNRILSLDLSNIVSLGTKGPEVLSSALKEFSALKNTILFLDNLHILYSFEGLDYISILSPYFENSRLKIICSVDNKTYSQEINRSSDIESSFRKIKIEEIVNEELYDFLILKNWDLRKKLTIPAINFLSYASTQVMFDQNNPKKSISLIEQASQLSSNEKVITKQDLAQVIKNNTGVSLGNISKSESSDLLSLEEQIKKEVVGQDKAVSEVVNSLIRARSIRSTSTKPIATFLFAGPTGVGKTELAKSLARNYFKGQDKIIRLDMSEYQTTESINRLIGSEDGTKKGILTESVKESPFNLLLLDEIEKAHPNIHMLFLQVFDDGRLTDSSGTTISFKNIIIIATTNAGTENVIEDFSKGTNYDLVRKGFMQKVKNHFPPEFLNRFTEIILFKPLNADTLEQILEIKLKGLNKQIYETKRVNITLTPEIKQLLLRISYSNEWGARSLERNLEKILVTSVSKALLQGEIHAGDNVEINPQFLRKYSSSLS